MSAGHIGTATPAPTTGGAAPAGHIASTAPIGGEAALLALIAAEAATRAAADAAASAGCPTYVQDTQPAGTGPYLWVRTSAGAPIDLLVQVA